MQKIRLSDLSQVSETLIIPLAVKAKETTGSVSLFADQKSVEILDTINTEGIIIDGGAISTHGILARTQVIDHVVNDLLVEKPNSIIINLGAGLDTRMSRLDNGLLRWYDLDLEEVIALRKYFFSENERVKFIAKSVMDFSWMDEITISPDDNVIIIAEGLLMYLLEKDVQQIFLRLSARFPKAHMLFDVVHTFFIGKGINSTFSWGIDSAEDFCKQFRNTCLVYSWSTGDLLKNRQPLFVRMMNCLPSTRNRSQVLHVLFK